MWGAGGGGGGGGGNENGRGASFESVPVILMKHFCL